MEQCPVCFRIFSAPRYLVSHLQLSECRKALPNVGTIATSNTTLVRNSPLLHSTHSERCTTQPTGADLSDKTMLDPFQNADTVHCPLITNAFGDIIVADLVAQY